jgi:hypothetical protein
MTMRAVDDIMRGANSRIVYLTGTEGIVGRCSSTVSLLQETSPTTPYYYYSIACICTSACSTTYPIGQALICPFGATPTFAKIYTTHRI